MKRKKKCLNSLLKTQSANKNASSAYGSIGGLVAERYRYQMFGAITANNLQKINQPYQTKFLHNKILSLSPDKKCPMREALLYFPNLLTSLFIKINSLLEKKRNKKITRKHKKTIEIFKLKCSRTS